MTKKPSRSRVSLCPGLRDGNVDGLAAGKHLISKAPLSADNIHYVK
jgi:hypothetical protein